MNYIDVELNLIYGVCAGFEVITDQDILDGGDKAVIIIDLLIVRVLIFYGSHP